MFGGFILIEVCDANPACCDKLFQLESEYEGVSIIENTCMSECELCASRPYLFLDSQIITAETVDELIAATVSRIHQLTATEDNEI